MCTYISCVSIGYRHRPPRTGAASCRDGGNIFTPERYRLELNSAHTFTWSQGPTTHTQFLEFFFLRKQNLERGKSYRLFTSARRRMLFAMPPAAG